MHWDIAARKNNSVLNTVKINLPGLRFRLKISSQITRKYWSCSDLKIVFVAALSYFRLISFLRRPSQTNTTVSLSSAAPRYSRSLVVFELQRPHIDALEGQLYRTVRRGPTLQHAGSSSLPRTEVMHREFLSVTLTASCYSEHVLRALSVGDWLLNSNSSPSAKKRVRHYRTTTRGMRAAPFVWA